MKMSSLFSIFFIPETLTPHPASHISHPATTPRIPQSTPRTPHIRKTRLVEAPHFSPVKDIYSVFCPTISRFVSSSFSVISSTNCLSTNLTSETRTKLTVNNTFPGIISESPRLKGHFEFSNVIPQLTSQA